MLRNVKDRIEREEAKERMNSIVGQLKSNENAPSQSM
jgi:hypothetical protein